MYIFAIDVYMMFIIGVQAKSIPQLFDLTEFLRPGSGYEGQRRASPHEPAQLQLPNFLWFIVGRKPIN